MIKKRERNLSLSALLMLVSVGLLTACGDGTTPPAPVTPTTTPPAPVVIPAPVVPPPLGMISGVVVFPGGGVAAASTGVASTGVASTGAQPWQPATRRRSGESIPGQYLVRLRPSLGTASLGTASLGTQSLSTLSVGGVNMRRLAGSSELGIALYSVDQNSVDQNSADQAASQSMTAASSSRLLTQLQSLDQVISAEPNVWYEALKTPNDASFPLQWNMQAINLPKAWDTTTGKAITVAVVDTGIVAHPDLAGQVLPGMDFIQDVTEAADGDGVDADPTDMGGNSGYHGSHVAGIIAAQSNNSVGVAGVSWGAKIVPVRVLGTSGGGSSADILLGTYWAAGGHVDGVKDNANPARVINLSLGGLGGCSSSEQQLFDSLAGRGVIVTVAAGNDNKDASQYAPANCKNVITVGATGPDAKRAPYSNYGARIDVMAPGGNTALGVKVGAKTYPGGIFSTVYDEAAKSYGYAFYQGTSMAAPHVAGALALLLGEQPTLTFAQVRARLAASSTPLGTNCGVINGCGAGLVNVDGLLNSTATPVPVVVQPVVVSGGLTFVVALFTLPDGSFDQKRSASDIVVSTTLRPPFSLIGLQLGKYTVAAWQDLNGNNLIDTGEPFGYTPAEVTQAAQKVTGLSIYMSALSSVQQATTSSALPAPQPALAPAALLRAIQSFKSTGLEP